MLRQPSTEGQRTEDWRQARAGSVTGSGFADVLMKLKGGGEAKTRQTYRMKILAERITGQPAADVSAPALSWGKDNEEPARLAYEMHMAAHGDSVYVEQVGFQQHPDLDWVGTSPDGFVGDRGMVEIKCPFNTTVHLLTIINASKALALALLGEMKPGDLIEVPAEHMPQIQGNLWVTGREWCDFVSYDPRVPEHLQLYVTRVYRDEAYIKNLEAEVRKFLDEIEVNVSVLLDETVDSFPKPKESK